MLWLDCMIGFGQGWWGQIISISLMYDICFRNGKWFGTSNEIQQIYLLCSTVSKCNVSIDITISSWIITISTFTWSRWWLSLSIRFLDLDVLVVVVVVLPSSFRSSTSIIVVEPALLISKGFFNYFTFRLPFLFTFPFWLTSKREKVDIRQV